MISSPMEGPLSEDDEYIRLVEGSTELPLIVGRLLLKGSKTILAELDPDPNGPLGTPGVRPVGPVWAGGSLGMVPLAVESGAGGHLC